MTGALTEMYSDLFASLLGYGISVLKVALKDQGNEKSFITQKHFVLVLFGHQEAYLHKHAICSQPLVPKNRA